VSTIQNPPTTGETAPANLSEVVTGLVNYTASNGPQRHWRSLIGLQEQLAARAFNLVVFGEFKRGKSTLINSLIGRPILPAAVVPLTSVITVVRYGEQLECAVTYQDGRKNQVPIKELSEYVAEARNPENVKQVAIVEVRVPSDLLNSGLFLVDTPGVGSIYRHNTEVTQDFLDQVDGALLVLAADPPISHSELQFAQDILKRTSKLFVVLNKVDQLSPTEREEALDFTRQVLANVVPEDALEVLPISARQGVTAHEQNDLNVWQASGVARLSARLQRFAEDDLLPTLQKSIARRAGAMAEELKLAVDLQRRSLELTIAQLKKKVVRYRIRRDAIMHEVNDSRVLVRNNVDQVVRTRLQEDYEVARREGLAVLRKAYAEWADEPRHAAFQELYDEVNGFIETELRQAISAWKDDEEQGRLHDALQEALERFGGRVTDKLKDIYKAARAEFDLPEPRMQDDVVVPTKSSFTWRERAWKIQLGTGFKWHWALLGEDRKKVALLREGERVLTTQFDQACGRLRHDFETRLRQGAEEYMDALMAALEQTLADIDRILDDLVEQREAATSRRDEELEGLEERAEYLEEQMAVLDEVLSEGSPERRQRERWLAVYQAASECVRQLEGVLIDARAPSGTGSPLHPFDEEKARLIMTGGRKFCNRLRGFLAENAPQELERHETPQPAANTLVWVTNLLGRLRQIADDVVVDETQMEDGIDAETLVTTSELNALHADLVALCSAAQRVLPERVEE